MLIQATNVVGGGDSWITDTDGSPKKWELSSSAATTLTITLPSTNWCYEPYGFSADGTEPPVYTSATISGSTLTLVCPKVTAAQQGAGGHDCYVQIRIIK